MPLWARGAPSGPQKYMSVGLIPRWDEAHACATETYAVCSVSWKAPNRKVGPISCTSHLSPSMCTPSFS